MRLAEWAAPRLPSPTRAQADELPLQTSLLEAAALASWGAVVAATHLGDTRLPADVAASLARAIHAAVAAGAPARQALYLLVGAALGPRLRFGRARNGLGRRLGLWSYARPRRLCLGMVCLGMG